MISIDIIYLFKINHFNEIALFDQVRFLSLLFPL